MIRKRSSWRTGVIVLVCLGLVALWGTLLYQVIAGKEIEAQVLSCADHSCEVAWSYGGAHGETSVNHVGAAPGGLVKVDYTPGVGITNREEDLAFVVSLPGVVGIALGLAYWRRSRSRAR